MAGSYLGHGAKYWADRYFESQTQTHLPDDPADLSWRDKYLALEKECSSYQATLADLRTEVEYLRTQRPVKYEPDLMSEQEAEKWESAYRRLYATLREKESQFNALSEEKHRKDLYQGKTAEQWANLYFSEQSHTQSLQAASKKKDSDIQALNTAIIDYKKFSEIDGHDSIYWHSKYFSLRKDSFNRRMFLMFVVFFFSFSAGATFTRSYESNSFSSSPVTYSGSLSPQIQPQTGIVYSFTNKTNTVPFRIITNNKANYYLCLCQGNKVIKGYYIRAGEMLSVTVPSGGYTIYYACAPATASWFGSENLWGSHTSYYRFSRSFAFSNASTRTPVFDFSGSNSYDIESLSKSDWEALS